LRTSDAARSYRVGRAGAPEAPGPGVGGDTAVTEGKGARETAKRARRAFNCIMPESNGGERARRLRNAAAVARSGVRRYPRELADSLQGRPPEHAPLMLDVGGAAGPLSAVWLGHATVLMRVGEQWVLTDPVFSHRIGVGIGPLVMGVQRRLPVVDLATLPPIDLILVSHAHFDHLDKPTLRSLASPRTRVITARNTRRLIPPGFGEVTELDWDRSVRVGGT
jgi:hypothetical protein